MKCGASVPVDASRDYANGIEGARLEILEDEGHFLDADPTRAASSVHAFLVEATDADDREGRHGSDRPNSGRPADPPQ